MVLQIKKSDLMSTPASIPYNFWFPLVDNSSNYGFGLYPVSYGQANTYGPGMLFISTFPATGNSAQLWVYDSTAKTINGIAVSSDAYDIGSDAEQPGTTDLLDVGDCRVKGAFYLYNSSSGSANIYFTFTTATSLSSIYNGVAKCKMTWVSSGSPSVSSIAFGSALGDFSHPNIASFGISSNDENILLSSLVTSPTDYPNVVVFSFDAANNYSPLLPLDTIKNYIDEYDASKAKSRWGDYMGLSRKFVNPPVVWASGSYGLSNHTSGTWIGEISTTKFAAEVPLSSNSTPGNKLYPNPATDLFNLEFYTKEETNCHIELISTDGKYTQRLLEDRIPEGNHKISLTTKELPAGSYIIRIISGDKLISIEKLIIKK